MSEHPPPSPARSRPIEALTIEQQAVVKFGDGPLLVVAGPGSGKTSVISHRIARRVRVERVPPDQVLAITFTRAAATQLRSRIDVLLESEAQVHVGTFHWVCCALLRRYIHHLGYHRDFRLLSPTRSRALLAEACPDMNQGHALSSFHVAMAGVKNGMSTVSSAADQGVDSSLLATVTARFHRYKLERNLVELDDLIPLAVRLLQNRPDVRRLCRGAHHDILVDEFQDVNPVQLELLGLLASPTRNVVAVGDDDQAIYGWRQALPESLATFQKTFQGSHVLTLQTNFRSSKHVVRVADEVIAHNRRRFHTHMRTDNPAGPRPVCFRASDEAQEAAWIAQTVRHMHDRYDIAWHEVAILFRVNAQARVLEEACLHHGVPYQIHSRNRFYERPEIRHAAAYARVALNRADDDAAGRLLLGIPGIGPFYLERLRRALVTQGLPFSAILFDADLAGSLAPPSLRAPISRLGFHARELYDLRQSSLPDLTEAVIYATKDDFSIGGESNGDGEDDFLAELASMAGVLHRQRGSMRTLIKHLDSALHLTRSTNGVYMLSLHAAKGLEFQTVFLCGMEEGTLPYRRSLSRPESIEEERRLCYVGITRARHHLFLSYARVRSLAGRLTLCQKSRFLDEMANASLEYRRHSPAMGKPPSNFAAMEATRGATTVTGSKYLGSVNESRSGEIDGLG